MFSTVLTAFNYNESFENLIKLMCDGDIFSHRIPLVQGFGNKWRKGSEKKLNFWRFSS